MLLPFLLHAQQLPKLGTLTIEDGLGFRRVSSIAQDSRGLMWFGTWQGIERYDGSQFVRFGNGSQANFFFPGEKLMDNGLIPLNDSILWAVADEALYALNIRSHRWKPVDLAGKICALKQASDGTIWIVTRDEREQRLLRHEQAGRFRQIARSDFLRQPFTAIAPDTAGNIWWSTITDGLRLFNSDGQLLHAAKPDSFIWYGTKMYFTPIFTDNRNRLFVFPKSKNQIWQYLPQEKRYSVLAANLPTPVYHALEDSQGNLWFSCRNGLRRWSAGPNAQWTDFTEAMNHALQFSDIYSLFEDQTHLIWVATDNGLFKLPLSKQLFQNHLMLPGAIWGNSMRGIFQDTAGFIYAYCNNGAKGLYRIDPKNRQSQNLFPFRDSLTTLRILEQTRHYVFDKKENAVWALTNKLLKIDLDTGAGTIAADCANVANVFDHNPLTLLRDGSLLFGCTLDKLTVFNPTNGHQRRFIPKPQKAMMGIQTDWFLEGPDGSIWVGTIKGLYGFERDGALRAHFSSQSKPALSKDRVLALHLDAAGRIWAGTFGGGLNCLERPGGLFVTENSAAYRIRAFTRKDGLSDNNVTGILEDASGNIWASTYNGLSCYRRAENGFQNFFEEDGLSNNEFNYSSAFKDDDGKIWFGGMNGLNSCDPLKIVQARENPPLCLTSFVRFNQRNNKIETQILGQAPQQALRIDPEDNWFQVNWALPNYLKPGKHHYYVWLEGLETGWSYLGNTPFVRYHKLPPGKYTLRVKGADSKGNWSRREIILPISVLPAFYQTWWFYLLVLSLVSGITYAMARYRLLRRLDVERMRTRIASDLHDEVGSMLSGLAMQAELLEMDASSRFASRLQYIGDISRAAVSKMRDLVWSLDSRRDRVQNLVERIQEQCAELLHPAGIAYQIELGELPLEKKLPVDTRQHLFLIFKEALSNVLRHSNTEKVRIRFGNFDGNLELSIHDDGPAKESTVSTTGMGLKNMHMRAKKLGGHLELRRENGFVVLLRMRAL